MAEKAKGGFITLEGGEGAGKSTQIQRLADALTGASLPVITTREPGGSPGAESIRSLLVEGAVDRWDAITELLLHYAARRDHLAQTILPALQSGTWVICDRFADSTMAYQGYGLSLGRAVVEQAHDLAVGDMRPDLTVILDVPLDVGLARAQERDGDDANRYERMDQGFHQRIRDGFLDIAKREPERCVMIDATANADTVHASILDAIKRRLGLSLEGSTA
jgi:dTMP kinase